jgi:DNA-binding NarL/FixJ family response regulator
MNSARRNPATKIPQADALSVAIVDPDAETRRRFASWVERTTGVRCAGLHECGEAALAALPAESPDVVLLEANLSSLNGLNSLGRLKLLMPQTRFYIYTGSIDPDHVFESLAAGAAGYFLKGTPVDELLAAIQENHGVNFLSRKEVALKVVESFHHFVTGPPAITLPRRQQEVLALLLQGRRNREIADALSVGYQTVITHIRRIFKKLHVNSRAQAVASLTQTRALKLTAHPHARTGKTGRPGHTERGPISQVKI